MSQSKVYPGHVLLHRSIAQFGPIISPAHKSLLHTLVSYGDPDGTNVKPGLSTLAEKEGCSIRWIRQMLRDLENAGYIEACNKKGGRGNKALHKTNLVPIGIQPVTTEVTTEKLTPPPEIPSSNVTQNLSRPPVTNEEEELLFSLQDWERRATSRPQSEFFKKKLLEAKERYQKFKEKQHVPTT